MDILAEYVQDVKKLFGQYKDLGDRAFAQLGDTDVTWKPDPESNSIATIVMHVSGNLRSRWTDFLTTDGEKPWRNRDTEFEERTATKAEIVAAWEAGWKALFEALGQIDASTLDRTITIRSEPYTVLRALQRSVTHTAYHVGQIVYVAKAIRSGEWKNLSIPKGSSGTFNASMGMNEGR